MNFFSLRRIIFIFVALFGLFAATAVYKAITPGVDPPEPVDTKTQEIDRKAATSSEEKTAGRQKTAVQKEGPLQEQEPEQQEPSDSETLRQPSLSSNKMIFVVTVPENTFEKDVLFIETNNQTSKFIPKTGERTYAVSLTADQIGVDSNGDVLYSYTRTEYSRAGEYVASGGVPGGGYYFGRKTKFKAGTTQYDTIRRWHWFPEGPLVNEDISDLRVPASFTPRINSARFRSVLAPNDAYVDGHEYFYEATTERIKSVGSNWVSLAPPWQWVETDPLPKAENDPGQPNYSDDMILRQMRMAKDHGLKVKINPGLCCGTVDYTNRSVTWWQRYYSELERFLLHYARLAEQANADAFNFLITPDDLASGSGINAEEKWRSIVANIRKEFSGEIGLGVEPEFGDQTTTLKQGVLTWGDVFDFFGYELKDPLLSLKDNPTIDELTLRAGVYIDYAKWLYDTYKKPVIVAETYKSAKHSWKGGASLGDLPELWDGPESSLFSGRDQAVAIHAMLKAVEQRPWVVGVEHFSYDIYATPLFPSWDIRAKAAEDLWAKWNAVIFTSR